MSRDDEIVWLIELRTFGILVSRGAFYSVVRFTRDQTDYEVQIDNDDYEFWEEHSIDYETEDGEDCDTD